MALPDSDDLRGLRVAFFSWRDSGNPEGGGAEHFLELVARGLRARGCEVTIFCAAYDGAPARETIDGIRYVRRGRKMSVYLYGMATLALRRLGKVDVVVDVQNGLPFFTRLVTRKPVVMLIHHVHREQWPVVYQGLIGKIGWFIESRVSPALYRRSRYVTVSAATKRELVGLGVDAERITIVHCGTDLPPAVEPGKSATPTIGVVSRLVPHKRVEQAIEAVAALREEFPDLRLHVVSSGWWEPELREHARQLGVRDAVTFEGYVDETTKHQIYERCWVMLLPSLKEGWGLVVSEAAIHGTPTVAYRSAGGTQESIEDGVSGVLVETQQEFTATVRRILSDREYRDRLGEGALEVSRRFTWEVAAESFGEVLLTAVSDARD